MLKVVSACILFLLVFSTFAVDANAYQTATSFQAPIPNWNVNGNGFWSCQVKCYHLGEDVGASAGTPVYAIANGLVKEAQFHNGYGGTVLLEHYTGSEYVVSVNVHMKTSTLAVTAGQEVSKGQLIGYVGTSAENGGWSEHCHLGIHKGQYQTGTTCDGGWVYAGYDESGCTQNAWYVPSDFIAAHQASYACQWISQNPSGLVTMSPGESRTFSVTYKNTGSDAWESTGGVSNPKWCELRSCNASGNVVNSWLYPGSGQGWINIQRVTTTGGTTQPQANGTFSFTGRVPSDASPGTFLVYFLLYHATGGYIQNWGGMHFQIQVEAVNQYIPLAGDWNGDGVFEVGLYASANQTFYLDLNNDGVLDWSRAYGILGDVPLVGDWDGDGDWTIGIYRPAERAFCLDYDNDGGPNWCGTYGELGDIPVAGDWDGNGTATIGIYRPSNMAFCLDYDNDGGPNWCGSFGVSGDMPIVGDWDGDGDLNSSVTIGIFRPAEHAFCLDFDNDCAPNWCGSYGEVGDIPIVGDWDGNGTVTNGIYRPSAAAFCLDYENDGVVNRTILIDPPLGKLATSATPPVSSSLAQNYPNPFNPTTRIAYRLPSAAHVTLEVYNMLGQRVVRLVDAHQQAGDYSVPFDASDLPSGVYLYRLHTDAATETRKMLILK